MERLWLASPLAADRAKNTSTKQKQNKLDRNDYRHDSVRSAAQNCGSVYTHISGADSAISTIGDDGPPEFIFAAALTSSPAPPRVWSVDGLIPYPSVSMFGGNRGDGKSLAAMQLAAATAKVGQWFGLDIKAGPVLYVSAEDDKDEINRRLRSICSREGISPGSLDNLTIFDLAGKDALLAKKKDPSDFMQATDLLGTIETWTADKKPVLIIIDTLAEAFGGEEINRTQVRQFTTLLRGISIKQRVTVLIIAHPSKSGMADESGYSGSTAWNNSVRARLTIERVKENEGFESDPDRRVIKSLKSNYGNLDNDITIRWDTGRFVLVKPGESAPAASIQRQVEVEDKFLELTKMFNRNDLKLSNAHGVN